MDMGWVRVQGVCVEGAGSVCRRCGRCREGVCVEGVVGAGSVSRWCGGCRECV